MSDRQEQGLQLKNEQRQMMSAVQIQSLGLLTLTGQELEDYVARQLLENPVLESEAEHLAQQAPTAPDTALPLHDDWTDRVYDRGSSHFEREDREVSAYEPAAIGAERSLHHFLLLQASLDSHTPQVQKAVRAIIYSLDDDGYFRADMDELSRSLSIACPRLEEALRLVQLMDPPGVGARNLQECLCLQVAPTHPERELLLRVINNYLPDLAGGRLRRVGKELGVSEKKAQSLLDFIRQLEPRPGSHFDRGEQPQYIIPDLLARKQDGKWRVELWDESRLQLKISEHYRSMLSGNQLDGEARDYVRQKIFSAQQLISNIQRRRETLLAIAGELLRIQDDFFDQGLSGLRPLTMRQVADRLDLHESTVSRAMAGKYIDTPRGLFALKFFFSRAYDSRDGAAVSSVYVRRLIRELVEKEDKARPLTDGQIEEILAARGIVVARRTIAKYRDEMGVPPRHYRRKS